jgi:hypothetical protein
MNFVKLGKPYHDRPEFQKRVGHRPVRVAAALGKPALRAHIAGMDKRIFMLIAGVIAAASGTILIAALIAPQIGGLPWVGPVLLAVALVLLLAQRRRRR